jgi:pimeloyl-ACP methyl ester carboxylesterase
VLVPLDRSASVPGSVRIHAARIRSRRASRPPLIGLTGGPGQAGVSFVLDYAYLLPTAGRDLVVFDQRGTGASGLLRCRSLERSDDDSYERAAGACGRSLGARRSFYTSADSADDLDALRIRLGVAKIAIYSISYGSRVAIEYARRHPEHLERMILDSPVAVGAPDAFGRETLGAVSRVLRAACNLGCGGAEAHPVSDVARLVKRLRRAPVRGFVRRSGRRFRVRVSADDLLGLLVASDLSPAFMRRIPPAVRSALAGHGASLVRLKSGTSDGVPDLTSEFSPAVYAATTCEEARLAWDPFAGRAARRAQAQAALDATPAAAFAPFDRRAGLNFGLLPLCGSWPAPARPAEPVAPLPTTIPTLVLSGDLDLRTPLENARALAKTLNGRIVTERGVGHQVLGLEPNGCATPAVEAFLAARPIPACDHSVAISVGRGAARRAPVPALR